MTAQSLIAIITLWLTVASAFQPLAAQHQKHLRDNASPQKLVQRMNSLPAPDANITPFETAPFSFDPTRMQQGEEQHVFVGQATPPTIPGNKQDHHELARRELPPSRMWQRWSRRLNTHEDARWVHKTSSASWLVSLLYIASVGAANGFAHVPDSLEIPIWISAAFSIFSSINGSQMAMKYRAKDPNMRNGFLNIAIAQVASAASYTVQGPFCPDMLDNYLGNIVVGLPFMAALCMTIEEAMTIDTKLEARELRRKEPSKFDFGETGDLITATLVVWIPLFMTAFAVPMILDPAHDRTWFFNELLSGSTEAQAANVYSEVFFNLSAGLGSVALTLRDRKLISKWGEQLLAWSMIVPAFMLSFQSLFLFK